MKGEGGGALDPQFLLFRDCQETASSSPMIAAADPYKAKGSHSEQPRGAGGQTERPHGTRPCSDGETGDSAAPLLIQTVLNFSRLCEFVVRGVLGPTGAAVSDASVFRDQAARRPTVNKLFQVWILASEHLTLTGFF